MSSLARYVAGLTHQALLNLHKSQSNWLNVRQVAVFAKPTKIPDIIERETELKPRQLREYFQRIELPEKLQNERRLGRLDSELLKAIVRGHVTHIPFENLSLVRISCPILQCCIKLLQTVVLLINALFYSFFLTNILVPLDRSILRRSSRTTTKSALTCIPFLRSL